MKVIKRLGLQGTYLKQNQGRLQQAHRQHQLKSEEKLKEILLKSATRQGCPLSLFLPNMWSLHYSNNTTEGQQGLQMGKDIKVPLFADEMIKYIFKF